MLIFGTTTETHLENLRQVFLRFRQFGLKSKPKKCEFYWQKVAFLGRSVISTRVEMGNQYIDAVRDWSIPQNAKTVIWFLGFANYLRNRFTRQFRPYLLGRHFTVRANHHSLTWPVNFRHPEGQIARLLEKLSQYNMIIEHRPGKKHINADVLSREIVDECKRYSSNVQLADLPCGKWQEFAEEVNDVIPLVQLFQEISTDDPAVGGGLTNVESKVWSGGIG